mmetsp:Transcript_18598/g.25788  ORF Transcript_18598/g.25788 Transcript_18598/m.25788 type:complete len:219 (+) Transcript_18598:44-700(+)|eukprot:CAMPEP_0196586350 /NCGR_PEP_ID=MMETSP1081-20130531/53952_1 /TAXON_ID=36882 /ORGANISM="Pyramimonas amylifera, Strain CCMP720" /LENGTH=218 /DNA_ID=CAMNT_0041908201 /DNA_START=43 /DNA_END=699 /DNA_ORIENTATION=-
MVLFNLNCFTKYYSSQLCFAAVFLCTLLSVVSAEEGSLVAAQFYPVEGTISLPDGLRPSLVSVTLTVNGVEKLRTLPKADGSFGFSDVPPGTHLLEVAAMGFFYPPIRVDVSARHNGKIHAAWAEDRRKVISPSMLIEPVKKMNYFEKRQEVTMWSIFGNPMMLMMIFTIVCVVIISNIDPETLKEMQQQAAAAQQPTTQPQTSQSQTSKVRQRTAAN